MELLGNLIVLAGVILIFNVMIFVHELGHFLAAKWRGLQVDKFYIWFGKPIWKKTIGGVEYGLGSIPAGGFVALPQMAPMEAIEGGDGMRRKALPPISPLDKIIVAFAGPLFSFLLALTAALIVWGIGKPADTIRTTVIGYVAPDSPAQEAGLQVGDRILSIDGEKVNSFMGGLDGISEKVMLSERKSIDITVERDGEPVTVTSGFQVAERSWFQRRAMRQIGIGPEMVMEVQMVEPGSPADWAGLKVGDVLLEAAGIPLKSTGQLGDVFSEKIGEKVPVVIRRGEEELTVQVDSVVPRDKKNGKMHPENRAILGIEFPSPVDLQIVHPSPWTQVSNSVQLMVKTIQAIGAKDSNVGIQHLSGPVGIGKGMFDFLRTEHALQRILWFMVVLNINLAIMNLMPFPVLDGGHILLALGERIMGRPVELKVLEIVQTGFVFVLLALFLFITTKDVGDLVPGKEIEWSGEWVWEKPGA